MKILISGYYGFGNLGDEAILRVLVNELKSKFPDSELVVLSQKPQKTNKALGIRAINRWNLLQIFAELKTTSLFVSGGGGLIQDRTSMRSSLYYLGLMELARNFCPVALVGQGIGAIKSKFIRSLSRKVMSRADLITLRDQTSREFLNLTNGHRKITRVASDLSLLLWPEWRKLHTTSGRNGTESPARIGVSLTGDLSNEFVRELAKQLDSIHESTGLEALFIAFHPAEDRIILNQVSDLMNSPSHVVYPTSENLEELFECIIQTKYVIGMRLHSLCFSLLASRPFFAISDDPKLERFISQIAEFGGPEMPIWTPDQLERGAVKLRDHMMRIEDCYQLLSAQLFHASNELYKKTNVEISATLQAIEKLTLTGSEDGSE
jgi:polysaccharide pyruvyl transferase CsaB